MTFQDDATDLAPTTDAAGVERIDDDYPTGMLASPTRTRI